MTDPRPSPYPADTRAKGWRFELDYERIEQSDTWALAEEVPMAQHALVFMWLAAWKQEPCGSMPNDDALIRSKCRVPPKVWATMRDVLMRGWWLADDGRLYHDMLVQRVMEMQKRRRNGNEVSVWAWGKLRRQVFERDGYQCRYCGLNGGVFECGRWHAKPYLTADHVVPKSLGGLSEMGNLVTACLACNSTKGARTPEEWRAA